MYFVFDGFESEFVGGAVDVSAFDSAAGHPCGESVVVGGRGPFPLATLMPGSAISTVGVRPNSPVQSTRGVFEHAALFQVFEECCDALVALSAEAFVLFVDVVVAVPGVGRVRARVV